MTEIPVAPLRHSIEFTDDGTRGYLADHRCNVVSVIVTATDTVLRRFRSTRARTAWRSPRTGRWRPT